MSVIDYSKWDHLEVSDSEDEANWVNVSSDEEDPENCDCGDDVCHCRCLACSPLPGPFFGSSRGGMYYPDSKPTAEVTSDHTGNGMHVQPSPSIPRPPKVQRKSGTARATQTQKNRDTQTRQSIGVDNPTQPRTGLHRQGRPFFSTDQSRPTHPKRVSYELQVWGTNGGLGDYVNLRVPRRGTSFTPSLSSIRTVPRFAEIHHLDNISTLHPVFFGDPDLFKPSGPDPDTGYFEIWGLHGLRWLSTLDVLNRTMAAETLYVNGSCAGRLPEIQFVDRLIKRKSAALAQKSRQMINRDFVLKVALTGIKPVIWRRFKVSGGISLHTLHKILLHIVGWNTQQYDYHSYCFVDQSDGAVFGPNKSTAVDSMLVFCNGYKFFDDKKLQLGLLLQKEGDRLLYIYDLGDQWEHLITVETILSEEVSTGACLVINGALHCPPEDSLGCWEASGNPSYQGLMDLLPRQKKWRGPFDSSVSLRAKILLKEGGMANNVTDGMLDPFKFEIEDVKDKLKKCITQSIRDMSGSKRTKNHGVAMCCNCGNPHNLHLCSACRMVFYCSRECQRESWEKCHSNECPMHAEQYHIIKTVSREK